VIERMSCARRPEFDAAQVVVASAVKNTPVLGATASATPARMRPLACGCGASERIRFARRPLLPATHVPALLARKKPLCAVPA
jgi:hypothetical protein